MSMRKFPQEIKIGKFLLYKTIPTIKHKAWIVNERTQEGGLFDSKKLEKYIEDFFYKEL